MDPDPAAATLSMGLPPWRLSGTVYGALLNHAPALAALGDRASAAPYKAAPRAPVLYVKPRNTLTTGGSAVPVPAGVDALEVGATLGVVIGRPACRLSPGTALDCVAGYLLVNDVCIPHAEFYRPQVRLRARDGFCPLGEVVPRSAIADPDAVQIRVSVDGKPVASGSTAELIRGTARLLADVTDFMTLSPGDVLLLGTIAPAPRARAGQIVRIEADGFPDLTMRYVLEGA
jgi:5-oxopent-3-ene-1,2,5-tricarboxylate decarboxylase / 2-hydroxyhepta-2,4-diene-1,7-dioate isomerase